MPNEISMLTMDGTYAYQFKDKTVRDGLTANMDYTGFDLPGGSVIPSTTGDYTPVGTIINYIGESAPEGYLECDGAEYNKADYTLLWNLLSSLADPTPYIVSGDDTKFKVPTKTADVGIVCIAYTNIHISVQVAQLPTDITNPSDGDVLTYDSTKRKWVNSRG